jgi:hypothetical protein
VLSGAGTLARRSFRSLDIREATATAARPSERGAALAPIRDLVTWRWLPYSGPFFPNTSPHMPAGVGRPPASPRRDGYVVGIRPGTGMALFNTGGPKRQYFMQH